MPCYQLRLRPLRRTWQGARTWGDCRLSAALSSQLPAQASLFDLLRRSRGPEDLACLRFPAARFARSCMGASCRALQRC